MSPLTLAMMLLAVVLSAGLTVLALTQFGLYGTALPIAALIASLALRLRRKW